MASVNEARDLYGVGDAGMKSVDGDAGKDRRLTAVSRKWSSSGLGLTAAEKEARRLEKKGTFAATMDEEANTVTLSKDDFKTVMGKLGGHKETAKRSSQNLILLAFGYLAVSIGFIAVIVGLMNWRIEASKESHVKSSTMVGKDGSPVKTATSLTPAAIDSRMSDAAWKEIRYLEISSPTGAYVSLFIEAYVRIPDKNAVYDSYLEFKTSSGTIKLEGKTLTFQNDISDILVKAGFQVSTGVSSTQRRLSVAHSLMGLFNSISAEDMQDWPGMDPLPKFPESYHATYQVGYSCISKDMDRCAGYEYGNGLPDNRVKDFWTENVPSRSVTTDFLRFVLTDAETWVDTLGDKSRTSYSNILPYAGWTLHETAIGNHTHVAQELDASKEAIFCKETETSHSPIDSKADYSNDWEGAYKGEVEVVTPQGTVTGLHFTLMPKQTAGLTLDMYLKRTSPTTAEPLIISIKQGENSGDRAYEQIVFRYTSFDASFNSASLNWYADDDTSATGAFDQSPYCLPDYGTIPRSVQILSEHPFPGAGPANLAGPAAGRFFSFAASGNYATSASTTVQMDAYATMTKAVAPPKKSYQGSRIRGYIQYMVDELSQMPKYNNQTIFGGVNTYNDRRRLHKLAEKHGDEAWKKNEHVSPYVVMWLKNQEHHKKHSTITVKNLNKAQHEAHIAEAAAGTKQHNAAMKKAAKRQATQKKVEKLRRELLELKKKTNRKLAEKEIEDEIAAEVVAEGEQELAQMLPDGRPQDWSDNDYLNLYIKEKDAFLHRRLSGVRGGVEKPVQLDTETYLATKMNVLDKAKLCDMKLAEGDFCRTLQELHGAKRNLAASVTTWPGGDEFVDSRCNSEFFFDLPLPAGTYNTQKGCQAACDNRYPDDNCRVSTSNIKGPFKSWRCVKRLGCRVICDPAGTLTELRNDIQNTLNIYVNRATNAIINMIPTIAELNEAYCCYNLGLREAWDAVEGFAKQLDLPMGMSTHVQDAFKSGGQISSAVSSKLSPYKCSSSGSAVKDWKINICAIEVNDKSINHYATQMRQKLVNFANEIKAKILVLINDALDAVASYTAKLFKAATGTDGWDGYTKNFWAWPSNMGSASCEIKMHHQLCKGAITCTGPMVDLGYGFRGQVGGGIHYDFNWFNILNDISVMGEISGRITWGLTIAGYGIEAFNLLLRFRIALESNGNNCNPNNGRYRLMASAELTAVLEVGALGKTTVRYPCGLPSCSCGWRGCRCSAIPMCTKVVGAGVKVWSTVTLGALYVPKSGSEASMSPSCTYDKRLELSASGNVQAEACAGICWPRWTVVSGHPIIQPWNVLAGGSPTLGSFSADLTPW